MDGQESKFHKGYCRTEPACTLNHIYHKNDNLSNPFVHFLLLLQATHEFIRASQAIHLHAHTHAY